MMVLTHAFIADVHIGNHRRHGGPTVAGINRRCQQTLDVLAEAVDKANEVGVETFVVAGDLLDSVRIEPQILAATKRILARVDGDCVIDLGNHEQASTEKGDHSLGVFRGVVETPMRTDGHIIVPNDPARPGPEAVRHAIASALIGMADDEELSGVLVAHLGVEDEHTPPWLRSAHDSIHVIELVKICKESNLKAAYLGNWHQHKTWVCDGILVCQIGALVPTGWDNPSTLDQLQDRSLHSSHDPYGSLVFWDEAQRGSYRMTLKGPRFLTAKSIDETKRIADTLIDSEHKLYLRVEVNPNEADTVRHQLQDVRDQFEVVEIIADRETVERQVQAAALCARSAETTEQALAEYVGQLALPEGVDRDRVLALCREYAASAQGKA